MITTPFPVLVKCSGFLKEANVDVSNLRLGYFTTATQFVIDEHKFSFARKEHDLTLVADTQTYDLTIEELNFNPLFGIYGVWSGNEKMGSTTYEKRAISSGSRYYLEPDDETIGFTSDIDGSEDINIWLYITLLNNDVSAVDSVLPFSIPEGAGNVIAKYMKFLVHDGKRQRNDARNAILDYKEELEKLIQQSGSNKIKGQPKTVPPVLKAFGIDRQYPDT